MVLASLRVVVSDSAVLDIAPASPTSWDLGPRLHIYNTLRCRRDVKLHSPHLLGSRSPSPCTLRCRRDVKLHERKTRQLAWVWLMLTCLSLLMSRFLFVMTLNYSHSHNFRRLESFTWHVWGDGVAQLVERGTRGPKTGGSNPACAGSIRKLCGSFSESKMLC